jgi:hypothetical protein
MPTGAIGNEIDERMQGNPGKQSVPDGSRLEARRVFERQRFMMASWPGGNVTSGRNTDHATSITRQ